MGAFPHAYKPYEYFDFAAGAFTALVVQGLGGADIIDVVSLDAAENMLATVTIQGGDGNDVLSTRTTKNSVGNFALTLDGGDGDDSLNIGTLSNLRHIAGLSPNSLDLIGSSVTVTGGNGTADSIVLTDSAGGTGHTYEITGTTVKRDTLPVLGYTTVESLRLISSSGNDKIEIDSLVASPFVTSVEDTGGTVDWLDFSDFAGGITLDLDTPAVQSLNAVVGGGPLLQLLSTYEKFTGTTGNDTVYVDPLVAAARTLDGGAGDDRLSFDGQGEAFTDSGGATGTGTLTPPGGSTFQPVSYISFQSGLTTNGPVRYLDNVVAVLGTRWVLALLPTWISSIGKPSATIRITRHSVPLVRPHGALPVCHAVCITCRRLGPSGKAAPPMPRMRFTTERWRPTRYWRRPWSVSGRTPVSSRKGFPSGNIWRLSRSPVMA